MKQKTNSKTMRDTGKQLCLMLGQAVRKEPVSKCETLDLKAAAYFARFHNILPMTYYALCQAGCDASRIKAIEKQSKQQAFKQTKLILMENELSNAFSKAKIPHFILKGSQIQRFFPEGMLRVSTDTDFYIEEQNHREAVSITESFGFRAEHYSADSKTTSLYMEPRYNIEIHSLLEDTKDPDELLFLQSLLNKPVRLSEYRYQLENENFYLHCFFHLYKHFSYCGAGVKMFLDLYVLSNSLQTDFSSVEKRLSAVGLDRFHNQVRRICLILFEGAPSDESMELVIARIFDLGAFGVSFSEANRAEIIRAKNKSECKRYIAARNYGLGLEHMSERYPILKEKPKLLPFYYVHRGVKGVMTKPKVLTSIIREKLDSKMKYGKQKKIFEIMGLDRESAE